MFFCDRENKKFFSSFFFVINYIFFSPQFKQLQDLKREGRSNEHVMKFFAAKTTNQDNSRSRKENTKGLFTRFYRYAVDIDLGCGYVKDIIDHGGGAFLEFGVTSYFNFFFIPSAAKPNAEPKRIPKE